MIKNRETLEYLFNIVKQLKKPLVAVYPNGLILGTDEQFASLNIIVSDNINLDIDNKYIFKMNEFNIFMRETAGNTLYFTPYEIIYAGPVVTKEISNLVNHFELDANFQNLYSAVIKSQDKPIIYEYENFQEVCPQMLSMKAADGAKQFIIDTFLMTSFNAIHPANKSDKVHLIIRECDIYSYYAEFIIYKKKANYQLHEYLRFRKI